MRVLIADSDSAFAKAVRLALRSEALVVEFAAGAADAVERAAALRYDAVVLDLALPGAGGLKLVQRLRRNAGGTPILALTRDADPAVRIAALRAGADDCLVHPVVMEELAARVHALARRAGRKNGDCLEIEDLVLHVGQRRAFRSGHPLTLTPREFVALEYLVRQHGCPVTAQEILGVLWEGEGAPAENFVSVLMMRLRRKVDGGQERKLLRTRRGSGYSVAMSDSYKPPLKIP